MVSARLLRFSNMHLRTLSVKNFRLLDDIFIEFKNGINVIVGPNASGKTTILEAIRLAKAILAPRTASETQQVLLSLNAAPQHNPQQVIPEALSKNLNDKLQIICAYELTAEEIIQARNDIKRIAFNQFQTVHGPNLNQSNIATILSTPEGMAELSRIESDLTNALEKITSNKLCYLDLEIDFKSGSTSSNNPSDIAFIRYLDQNLPPGKTKFSYFSADRALPRGEVNMQFGSPDASQKLESHNSQPLLKYNRLKNEILNTILSDVHGRVNLELEFSQIFEGILKGRKLAGAGINEWGQFTILIEDLATGFKFDIDGMSSGEKGLVLTFLLIGRSIKNGGLVLFDEPELHLNPAVCKEIIPFLLDNYVLPNNLQMIICSHSPEILTSVIGRDECSLFHLENSKKVSRVIRADEESVIEALRQLGTSQSDGLMYKGTIFVEGPHDVELIEYGFPQVLKNFKLRDLGGRYEIEKQIRELQYSESKGNTIPRTTFIFDLDNKPTGLISSSNVKIIQWKRHCLENYLIDEEIIWRLLTDNKICKDAERSLGDVSQLLKELAKEQLNSIVAKEIYQESFPKLRNVKPHQFETSNFEQVAMETFNCISEYKLEISTIKEEAWKSVFIEKCNKLKAEKEKEWDVLWKERCDGKRLFSSLQQSAKLSISNIEFKRKILSEMRTHKPDAWLLAENLLKDAVS